MLPNPGPQAFADQPAVAGDRAQGEEIRAYILNMAVELAAMADRIQDTKLADSLRLVAWCDGPRLVVSRRR